MLTGANVLLKFIIFLASLDGACSSFFSDTVLIDTHLGSIGLIKFGPAFPLKNHPEPVVMVPGSNRSLVKEWSVVADALGKSGYSVAIVDFFSSQKLPSQKIGEHDFDRIIFDNVLKGHFGAEHAILMGKSFGGLLVITYANTSTYNLVKR